MTTATAPGKIILFGEHSVVYGRPALAVPVNQVKAVCQIEAGRLGQGIEIIAQDLDQQFNLRNAPIDDPLAAVVRQTLATLALSATPDLVIKVTSTIPIARGLGSGAAISTAIVKALGEYFRQPFTPQVISEIAFEVEKIHHGTPSGIDNSVVAFGQPIFFQKGQTITQLKVHTPLTFVIGDTGIKSPTRQVVADLRARRARDVDLYEGYFDEMAAIVIQARDAIEGGRLRAIGKYMTENHAILDKIGVSSPELNQLVEAALQAKALGAKLSGAGWGGNMIALASAEEAQTVAQALNIAGAIHTIVTEVKPPVS